jgi:hypothetical protein
LSQLIHTCVQLLHLPNSIDFLFVQFIKLLLLP